MQFPWRTALNFDFQFSETSGERPAATPESIADAKYMRALGQAATADVDVAEALFLSTQTFDPGQVRRPEIVARVEEWMASGRTPPYTDPAVPPPNPDL